MEDSATSRFWFDSSTLRYNKTMTAEEARVALQLEPWEKFRDRQERKDWIEQMRQVMSPEAFAKERWRMSGRTTRMLCSAVAAMWKGLRVKIYASNRIVAESIEDDLRVMAKRLGTPTLFSKDSPDLEFFDHTYYELLDLPSGR